MNAKEAADVLRPNFHLESMPPEDRHHVVFVEAVAAELGVDPTPFNLHQVAAALDAADIHPDDNEYPKMLYSRQHHAEGECESSFYDPRHDWCWVHVANEREAKALGDGWVDNPADLPPRGETPIAAPVAEPQPAAVDLGPKSHPDGRPDELTGIGAGSVGVAKPEDAAKDAAFYDAG